MLFQQKPISCITSGCQGHSIPFIQSYISLEFYLVLPSSGTLIQVQLEKIKKCLTATIITSGFPWLRSIGGQPVSHRWYSFVDPLKQISFPEPTSQWTPPSNMSTPSLSIGTTPSPASSVSPYLLTPPNIISTPLKQSRKLGSDPYADHESVIYYSSSKSFVQEHIFCSSWFHRKSESTLLPFRLLPYSSSYAESYLRSSFWTQKSESTLFPFQLLPYSSSYAESHLRSLSWIQSKSSEPYGKALRSWFQTHQPTCSLARVWTRPTDGKLCSREVQAYQWDDRGWLCGRRTPCRHILLAFLSFTLLIKFYLYNKHCNQTFNINSDGLDSSVSNTVFNPSVAGR